MQTAFELFESQAYTKAEKAFIELSASRPVESAKYLCLISKRLGKKDFPSRYNQYLDELYKSNSFKELSVFHKEQNGPLSMSSRLKLIQSLWQIGSLADFGQHVSLAWKELIAKKYYAYAEDLYTEVNLKDPYLLVNHYGRLTVLMETGLHEEAGNLAGRLLELTQKNWSKIKSSKKDRTKALTSLLQLLKIISPLSIVLEKAIFDVQIEVLNAHGPERGGPIDLSRFAMEYSILFKDDRKRLEKLLMLGDLPARKELEEYLKKRPQKGVTIRERGEEKENDDFLLEFERFSEARESLEIEPTEKSDGASPREEFIMSAEEEELVIRIKAGDPDLVSNDKVESIAHTLFGIGHYRACIVLAEASGNSERLAYLKAQALWETNEYLELLDFSTSVAEKLRNIEERSPFWYLGAKAALKLEKIEEARLLLRQIIKADPEFRDAKELLRSAKA